MLRRSACRVILVVLLVSIIGCAREEVQVRPDMDVVSRSLITGSVNQSPVEGTIVSTIHTGQGGTSTCSFTQLPATFNPGTFGTHT